MPVSDKLRLPLLKQKLDACVSRFEAPIDAKLYRIFVSCLALKLVLEPLLRMRPLGVAIHSTQELFSFVSHPQIEILALAAALVIFSRKFQRIGLGILFGVSLVGVVQGFPHTANHYFLETFLLAILLLWPPHAVSEESEQRPATVDGTACRLIMFAILSVFFWSGVQKIVHGYYLNGEFFALFLFNTERSAISPFLLACLEGLAAIAQTGPLPRLHSPDWLRPSTFSYPSWAIHFFLLQSYLAVIGETFIPLMLLFKKTRWLGAVLLIPTAMAIALISGETGFALTNVACVLLFFPKQARWSYVSSFVLILAIHFVRLVSVHV